MNARWLSLPLTARGLLRELAAIVGADGALDTALAADAPATTIGAEVARLLCAFPHEHTRVKRDVVVLIERGFVIVDASLLRVVGFDEEVPPDADIVRPAKSSDGGSAKRMRTTPDACSTGASARCRYLSTTRTIRKACAVCWVWRRVPAVPVALAWYWARRATARTRIYANSPPWPPAFIRNAWC